VQQFLRWKINKYYHNQMNGTIFGKRKVVGHKMCFDFFTPLVRKIAQSKKN